MLSRLYRFCVRRHVPIPLFVFRTVEALRSVGKGGGDGGKLPMPPGLLAMRVAGSPSPRVFLEGGELAARSIRETLRAQGVEDVKDVLDFGCGCGRVLRWLMEDSSFRLRGIDLDAKAIEWCQEHLAGVGFDSCGMEPPLRLDGASLDLVYALSVFTHLEGEAQKAWLAEFHRVLRPGRYVLVSTHGEAYRDSLEARERERFERGEVVVRFPGGQGTNLCNVYHPTAAFVAMIAPWFRVVSHSPEGARGNPRQDLWLLQSTITRDGL